VPLEAATPGPAWVQARVWAVLWVSQAHDGRSMCRASWAALPTAELGWVVSMDVLGEVAEQELLCVSFSLQGAGKESKVRVSDGPRQ
jgi:hypothetical protein